MGKRTVRGSVVFEGVDLTVESVVVIKKVGEVS